MSTTVLCSILIALSSLTFARDSSRIKASGSFESNSALYVADPAIGFNAQRSYGSNNYLKLDLVSGHFSAGFQAEAYPEPLLGYSPELKGAGIPFYYVKYRKGLSEIELGSFYEQLGSGLLLRAWEDRQLGINNAITGLRAAYSSKDNSFNAKILGGLPRYCLNSAGAGHKLLERVFSPWHGTAIAGADASVDIAKLLKSRDRSFTVEGSLLCRHEKDVPRSLEELSRLHGFALPEDVLSWSVRSSYSSDAFSVKFEHVSKGPDFHIDKRYREQDGYSLKGGSAQLLEMDLALGDFTAALHARRLSNMQQALFRSQVSGSLCNTLNYIPALCQQQTYMLAMLNPYVPLADGELGGELDLFYNFRKGTALGGRYGMKLHVNGSLFYTPPEALSNWQTGRLAYRDFNAELEKRWSRRLRTTLFVSIQELSPTHGDRFKTDAQNVFVLDGTYRFDKGLSIRAELQYLYSKDLDRDWCAALLELGLAPRWNFFVSDMYNHGGTGIHYYNCGIAYSHRAVRLSGGFGRVREGLVCAGGVCRWQPACTGGNINLTYSF